MSYEQKLACKRKGCTGYLTIPIKLVLKGTGLVIVSRCPNCHQSSKDLLPMGDKSKWLPIIAEQLFKCDICGTGNKDNYQYAGTGSGFGPWGWHPYMFYNNVQQQLKISFQCKSCGKKRAKVVSSELWSDVATTVEKPAEPPTPELKCPHCDVAISLSDKVCPSCKTEIRCDKCDAAIAPNAAFCSRCGDKVEKIELPASKVPTMGMECPTCHEEYKEGSIYCSVCGQELFCDKCGAQIHSGAEFCVNCGDAVIKGDLSE